jgi:mannitol/fructose-specific phosphotransferase system IIA component (Ntr-type)
MKIYPLLDKAAIHLDVALGDKAEAMDCVAGVLHSLGLGINKETLLAGLLAREAVMSTGIGCGVAIPHAAFPGLSRPAAAVVRPKVPLDFGALDACPVFVLLAVVCPAGLKNRHIQILAALARLCANPGFMAAVRETRNPSALLETIRSIEEQMAFH